jgi:hypothetical protein
VCFWGSSFQNNFSGVGASWQDNAKEAARLSTGSVRLILHATGAHTPNPSDHYALFYGFPLTEGKTGLKKAKKTAAEAAVLFSIRLF